MSVKSEYAILGLGNPFCDRIAHVDDPFLQKHHLARGQSTFTNDRSAVEVTWKDATQNIQSVFQWALGGSGTNVIKTLAYLGNKCAIQGKIGSDEIGKNIEARLKEIGVTSWLSKELSSSGIVNCFVTPDAQRTMHASLGISEKSCESDCVLNLPKYDHIHIEGYAAYFEDTLENSIAFAKKRGASISLDLASCNVVEQFKSKFEGCLSEADYLFSNVEEMQILKGHNSVSEAMMDFDSHQTIVVTNGSNGCWVKNRGESEAIHYNAREVRNVKDTTGAGDFFAAGFIHGSLRHKDVSECVMMGNLAASFVIQEEGADLPEEKWCALRNLIWKI